MISRGRFRAGARRAFLGASVALLSLLPGAYARAEAAEAVHLTATAEGGTFAGKTKEWSFPRRLRVETAGRSFTLRALGSGIRRQLIFDVYEAVAYVDTAAVLRPDVHTAMVEGEFARRVELHFLHAVDGKRTRGAMQEGFRRVLGDVPAAPGLEADITRFMVAMGDAGAEEKDVVAITWIPGAGLYVTANGVTKPPIESPLLGSTVMAIWFGRNPVGELLKRDMVRLLQAEGGP